MNATTTSNGKAPARATPAELYAQAQWQGRKALDAAQDVRRTVRKILDAAMDEVAQELAECGEEIEGVERRFHELLEPLSRGCRRVGREIGESAEQQRQQAKEPPPPDDDPFDPKPRSNVKPCPVGSHPYNGLHDRMAETLTRPVGFPLTVGEAVEDLMHTSAAYVHASENGVAGEIVCNDPRPPQGPPDGPEPQGEGETSSRVPWRHLDAAAPLPKPTDAATNSVIEHAAADVDPPPPPKKKRRRR